MPAFLLLVLAGCAANEAAAPTQPMIPPRIPVRVMAPSPTPKPSAAYADAVATAKRESRLDEDNLENFTTRIKKLPTTKRTSTKGEKVYPIDLNLQNADLVEAIRVLAGTMGLNYSIDPRVKGTANVRASGKLSQSDLLSIMDTLLNINGATMIKTRDLYNIVPVDKAMTRGLPVYSQGAVPPGMRAQVVFLEQTPVKEVAAVLKPLVSPAGTISEAAHNALVLIDNPDNLDKLLQLIHLMDSRALAQTLVRVVRVQNTDPTEIIKEMESIFTAYGTLSQKDKADFGVSFMAVERLNSVMILANSRPLMERALYWVKQLDLKTDLLANVHIYHVDNYKAKNLASILTQVYGGTVSAPTIKETKSEGPTLSQTTTSTSGTTGGLGSGTSGGLGTGTSSSTGLKSSLSSSGGTTSGTTGTGVGALKERAAGLGAAQGSSPKEGVRIIPDEENNLLVVVAPPHEWNIIFRVLKQLDIMPRQVLNEVLIAEIRLNDQLKYGLEFLLGQTAATAAQATSSSSSTSGLLVSSTSSTGTSSTTSVTPADTSGVTISTPASAAFSAASGGLTLVALDTLNKLKALINLLAIEGKVNILASPHIMAANNQEARIMIGEEVPILTSTSTPLTSVNTSLSTSTVQYRSTGIILSVKPQINAKGLVTLEIAQEVSDAATTTTGVTGTPTFTVRQAKTSLTTGNNQTVVLGGLIRETSTHTVAGVPGLRRLPLLGPLFGSDAINKQKTELLVLITPHIVDSLEEGAHLTHQMKEKIGLEETGTTRRTTAPTPQPSPAGAEAAPKCD